MKFKYEVSMDRTNWVVVYADSASRAAANYVNLTKPKIDGYNCDVYVRGAEFVNGWRLTCTVPVELEAKISFTYSCDQEEQYGENSKVSEL